MQIIDQLEARPRGAYTGSIGVIEANGDAAFNVAIRTLTLKAGASSARIGLGSGIVADSRAGDEWRECLAKGAFVSDPDRSFDLIETMRFDPHEGVVEIERHLGRIKRSADALGFGFDRHGARNELQAATFRLREARKVRLLLSPSGAVSIEIRVLPEPRAKPVEVALVRLPIATDDFRLRYKTTDRAFYDQAREKTGAFEILFQDEAGFLTEGSFTNLFVERGGRLATPPLGRGLLPGILRERLIERGEAVEADLVAADLVAGFYLGNAVRGLIPAKLRDRA
jgi:para-aminobenzoate synthetase/4-amino-4-deoxychorismate lyase